MRSEHPYRHLVSPSWFEEDLWLRLDGALEQALAEPMAAYSVAWFVYFDASRRGHRDVATAADRLLVELSATIWAPYLKT